MKYDVFISYSRKDSAIVNEFAQQITNAGYSVWMDIDSIETGDEFKGKIAFAIKNSKLFLFFSSLASNESEWTVKEVNYAIKKKIPIIPIRLDNADYNDSVDFDLAGLDFIQCNGKKGLDVAVKKLMRSLEKKIRPVVGSGFDGVGVIKRDASKLESTGIGPFKHIWDFFKTPAWSRFKYFALFFIIACLGRGILINEDPVDAGYSSVSVEGPVDADYSSVPVEDPVNADYLSVPVEDPVDAGYSSVPVEDPVDADYSSVSVGKPLTVYYSSALKDKSSTAAYLYSLYKDSSDAVLFLGNSRPVIINDVSDLDDEWAVYDYSSALKYDAAIATYLSTLDKGAVSAARFSANGDRGISYRVDGVINGHEYVDLGLSVKWATCNVGATKPEEYGGYYAWGETEEKYDYDWYTYKWCNGSPSTMTKYCTNSSFGTVDNKTTLALEDDVAHVKWGGTWRMPTKAEQDELRNNCTWSWTTLNSVNGYKVTSKTNGNSIFLPAAGGRSGTNLNLSGSLGYYWSGSLYESYGSLACYLYFYGGDYDWRSYFRYYGLTVRPVSE